MTRNSPEELTQTLYEELKEKEAELRRVLASVPGYLWSLECDGQGRLTHAYHSPGVERITGRPPEFYTSDPERWLATIHPADRPPIEAAYRRFQEGSAVSAELEYRVVWPNGAVRWVRNSITASKADDGTGLRLDGVVIDINERKQAEEALRASEAKQRLLESKVQQVQKMEAIGQLAGGVAHDFNNLLTVILGNISLLRGRGIHEESDEELLSATETAAVRAAELTSKLLSFSRRTAPQLVPTNLNTCVEETVMILRRTIDPTVAITMNTAPDLWQVAADAGQLNQVLMNLCLNARDAMPKGGRLRLETANIVLDEEAARAQVEARPGEFVRLRVEDTGHGMPAEVRQRIFEPFFTTKEPGKGTGLGLAMVFGIVKQHKGWIECSSEVGRGTRFDVYLPRSAGQNV